MTDIIDKVAEALEESPFQDDIPLQGTTQQHMRCRHYATAALEALAEGLVWDGDTLRFMDCKIGTVGILSGRAIFNNREIGVFDAHKDAQSALFNHARRVLFGLGPVGEGNG